MPAIFRPSKPCQFWDDITNQLRRKGKKIRTSRNLMGNTSFPHSVYRFGMVDVGTYDAVRPREGPVGLGRVRARPTFLRSRPDSPALQVCPKEKGRRPTLCRQPDRDATCFARVLRAADPTRLQSHGKRLADCCRCDRKALEYIQKRNVVFVLSPIFFVGPPCFASCDHPSRAHSNVTTTGSTPERAKKRIVGKNPIQA